ncbi:MAG: hypothetical protein WCA21_21285 [Terracidiphilus sp.]
MKFTWIDLIVEGYGFGGYYLFPWLAGITIIIAGVWRIPARNRKSAGFKRATFVFALLTFISLHGFLRVEPFYREEAKLQREQAQRDAQIAQWTFHPSTPTTYDGIVFPAGSEVQLDPDLPHHLSAANLSAPTKLFGLTVIGDFKFEKDTVSPQPEKIQFKSLDATLVEPAEVNGIPCGKGAVSVSTPFKEVRCTLSRDYALSFPAGAVLAVGSQISFETAPQDRGRQNPNNMSDDSVDGVLAKISNIHGYLCEPGEIHISPSAFTCTAHSQTIMNYALQGGTTIDVGRSRKWDTITGILAKDASVEGIPVPAGTQLNFTNLNGRYDPEGDGQNEISFHLLTQTEFDFQGAHFKGDVTVHIDGNGADFTTDSRETKMIVNGVNRALVTYHSDTHQWSWQEFETCPAGSEMRYCK